MAWEGDLFAFDPDEGLGQSPYRGRPIQEPVGPMPPQRQWQGRGRTYNDRGPRSYNASDIDVELVNWEFVEKEPLVIVAYGCDYFYMDLAHRDPIHNRPDPGGNFALY